MSIYDKASLVQIPSGVKSGTLYNVVPNTADGDFDFTRSSTATRVNKDGLIETVASGVPRLDYPLLDGVVQDCPAFLLEPTRTNFFLNSNSFVSSSWFKSNVTVSANQAISPTGENNASLLTATVDNGILADFSEWTTTERTASFFAKKNTSSVVEIIDASSATNFVRYDLENGAILSEGGTMTGEMQNYGNGWYRVIATYSISSGTNTFGFRITNAGSVYIYGAQIEEASYTTSYIHTGASTVTRSADVCNGAGTADTFNDSEGVLFAEISALADDGTSRRFSISDGTNNNRVLIGYSSSSRFQFVVSDGGSVVVNKLVTVSDIALQNKVALKYKLNDCSIWINGYEVDTDTVATMPSGLDTLNFDQANGTENFYGKSKQVMTFNEALSDTELENLTSWDSFGEMATGQLYTIE